jgi:hypothetical protein
MLCYAEHINTQTINNTTFLMHWGLTLQFVLEHVRIAKNGDPERIDEGKE